MKIILVVFLALFFNNAYAVKEYLFKSCNEAGFCHRNRHYGEQISKNTKFVSPYFIEKESIQIDHENDYVSGLIVKKLTETNKIIELPFEVWGIGKDSIRFRIDEDRSTISSINSNVNPHRYNETSKWSFTEEIPTLSDYQISLKLDKLEISYGFGNKYKTIIDFNPFKVTVFKSGVAQIVANGEKFLNIEHWRSEETNEANMITEESDFDMFHDSFKDSIGDSKPLGPESVALDFTFKNFQHVYGIPEHADSLDLQDTKGKDPYRLYNVDIFEYETDSRLPMYGSIPFMISSKPDSSAGIFWVNSADTYVDIDKNSSNDVKTHWISENGVIEFILFVGEKPSDINYSYGLITGFSQLPQISALGNHQCRWNYNDEKDVLGVDSLFDKNRIPYDYIWLDIEYAERKKYFTWNLDTFPDPQRMMKELDKRGRGLVVIVDPHLKKGYYVSDYVDKHKISIKDKTNNTYFGHCWPGESLWIDSLNPNSQAFWDKQHENSPLNTFIGTAPNVQLWNDMNEPSVFNGPETSAPKDLLHYGSWEHRSIHNLFGLSFHEATYKSMRKRMANTTSERPFVLTRSFFAGSQRSAAMWTGDNMSKWEYLKASIPMVLTMGVSGMPFAGADIGGFFGNPSPQLLVRWYQTGIWYPFMRAHAHIDSRRREPWMVDDYYKNVIRDTINLRYSLIPVIYHSFYVSSQTGEPILRPIFYENPENKETYSIDDQFFLGDSGILVKPITEDAYETKIYLPDDENYYEFDNGVLNGKLIKKKGYIQKSVELKTIPMFLKGGSIIMKKDRYRRSVKLMENDPYHLIIALNKELKAQGQLYIDDGKTFDYLNKKSLKIDIVASTNNITADIITDGDISEFEFATQTIEKITIIGFDKSFGNHYTISQNGNSITQKIELNENVLTIKNPKLSISEPWFVSFSSNEEYLHHDEL